MMKFLYKTFLISIISGSLTTMNMTAYAEENTTATAQMSKSSSTGYSRDANGVLKKTETHNFEGNKGKDDNAINAIMMIVVGIIGMKLLTYKKWTLDMTMVAVASAAYIVAEVLNIMNLKKQLGDMDAQVTKRTDGKIDQAQIDTLQQLKESYEKAKSAVKTRKTLQQAAAAAFAAATAVAAWQRYSEDGKFASCQSGITTGLATLTAGLTTAAAATPVSEALVADYKACIAQVEVLQTDIVAYKAKCEATVAASSSMFAFTATNPAWVAAEAITKSPCGVSGVPAGVKATYITPACSTYLGEAAFNKAFGIPQVASAVSHPSEIEKILFPTASPQLISMETKVERPAGIKKYLQNALDMIFPKAEAGYISLLGLGTAALVTYKLAEKGMTQTIDTWMYTPGARIIAWGLMTGVASMGAGKSQEEIDKIDENIKKIDQILTDMNTLKAGMKASNVSEQQIKFAAFKASQFQDLPINPNAAVKTDCLSGNASNGACASLSDQMKSMPGFSDLPDSFRSIASQTARLGDGLSGTNTISGSTLTTAANMGNNQRAIAKFADKIKTKINDSLSKNGKAKVDFAKQEKDLWNKMKGQTEKALKSNGMSAGSFLASTGISPLSSANAIASKPTFPKPVSIGSGVAGPAASSKDKDDKEFSLDLSEETAAAEGPGWGSEAGTKEEKFDIGSNDINTNSGDSIFQVISNRYIKSGYPKLLDEIPVKN